MPTDLPAGRRKTETADGRTLFVRVAAVCALMGVSLIEPAFTDTAASPVGRDVFGETAAFRSALVGAKPFWIKPAWIRCAESLDPSANGQLHFSQVRQAPRNRIADESWGRSPGG